MSKKRMPRKRGAFGAGQNCLFESGVEVALHVLEGIDGDLAAGLDVLHDELHDVLGYADAAAGIGAVDSETMEEEREAFFLFALGIVAHVQDILIRVIIIGDMLAVLGIEIGDVLDVDKLIEIVLVITRPIVVFIDLSILHLTAGIVGKSERLVDREGSDRGIAIVDVGVA